MFNKTCKLIKKNLGLHPLVNILTLMIGALMISRLESLLEEASLAMFMWLERKNPSSL